MEDILITIAGILVLGLAGVESIGCLSLWRLPDLGRFRQHLQ